MVWKLLFFGKVMVLVSFWLICKGEICVLIFWIVIEVFFRIFLYIGGMWLFESWILMFFL